ncbi:DNA repair protein rhp26 [Tritrichomonas foetus]|uniref:DNA repair protein rhp26 n=1 Tax=Tritrichomonas foetus TaxID=1144522 RepID=A0A1J4J8H0_9EUKA|nr:DNA repair protein rhp26 [Tritrichomonas foetus]|eukprot:OHS94535.1 DNA repair protein rhp26 [Tritrichomonas foetus]
MSNPTDHDQGDVSSEGEEDGFTVLGMDQYEKDIINNIGKNSKPEKEKESKEKILKKIKKYEKLLADAKLHDKKKLIEKYSKLLDEERFKLEIPDELNVEITTKGDSNKDDEAEKMPEQNEELMKYWHYKVMHTAFAGEDSINLTLDDSDPLVFKGRNAFIRDHCEPYSEMKTITDNLKMPKAIYDSLFPHQKVAIDWLWRIYNDKKGGIEGDEMGLGKTAIACTFIHALIESNILKKPTLILCPLTVGQQWIRELHIWCPQIKAIFLHKTRANKKINDSDLLKSVEGTNSVIVTNYETLHTMKDNNLIHIVDWGIVICDEGHKIRNHESSISKLVKKITADFRLAISGSPIQNSLIELWSLFDFAIPGLLGSIDVFTNEFAEPIKIGGYANASSFQVFRAYSAAVALRELIQPYLLRRMKKDVSANLPGKLEQIFFVTPTQQQIFAYEQFNKSSLCRQILNGNGDLFVGIDHLRKICNHPHMADAEKYTKDKTHSAKLNLLKKILPKWKKSNHRCLLFSQYLQMLDFIGELMDDLGLDYFRLDGTTAAAHRQVTMDNFNNGEKFACLLSTKVGGVGVNLTGADRVVIVDPDWNPSTDNQALERAWRIGQTKDVVVYRLITVGTIEEKMYKKQIFKTFLSNKILQNPQQRRLFAPETVRDLFRLDFTADFELGNSAKIEISVEDDKISPSTENNGENENDNTSENEKDSSKDDKEIMKCLFEDGNLQGFLHHDEIFKTDNLDNKIDKTKAERRVEESLKRLRKSKSGESKSDKRILNELIEFFHAKRGIALTKAVLKRFEGDPDIKRDPHLLKDNLRVVAVLNKRTHQWHLKSKYK